METFIKNKSAEVTNYLCYIKLIRISKIAAVFIMLLFSTSSICQRQMEILNRGLVAVRTGSNNVYLSWRLFGNDPDSIGFNIYCNNVLVNALPIYGATNYNHTVSSNSQYYLKPVIKNIEQASTNPVSVMLQNYFDIPLLIPAGGTTPDGVSYTYSPNDASVGDLDGDGEYEIILKWDPSNSKDNSQDGYTGRVFLDAYKFNGTRLWRIDLGINIRAGAHYTQFMVYDLDGDGKAEVACKTAPGTKSNNGTFLSNGPASSDNDATDYRNAAGRILSGPEYLTVFNGETGQEAATVNYEPLRGSVNSWGDDYGNRVDRFLACIAYLDGVHPSLVMCRGYYTRTVLVAYDWNGGTLTKRWSFDSNNGYPTYVGQGNHNLSVADVDGDGKDEIVYGSCTIDNDGTGLYNTGFGHGDAIHVSDLDPDRPGLEVFACHENGKDGVTFRDAGTGALIWQRKSTDDVGRALSADILAGHKGSESWATSGLGVYNTTGDYVGVVPSLNYAIWWNADDLRELLDGTQITKYGTGSIFSATNCSTNNGTKSTASLQADIFGDWREEVIFRTSDNQKLRIFTTTDLTSRKIYTLMHDPVYRLSIAWQNVAYNQPPYTSFYLGYGMQDPPKPPMRNGKLIWNAGTNWDLGTSTNWISNGSNSVFTNNADVLFDLTGSNTTPINIVGQLSPKSVFVNSPSDFIYSGSGKITGNCTLDKSGSGKFTIENINDFSGITRVWEGNLEVNNELTNSTITVYRHATLSGIGKVSNGIIVNEYGHLSPGNNLSIADTLFIGNKLIFNDGAILDIDLSDDASGTIKKNDLVVIDGNIIFPHKVVIAINKLNGSLATGSYKLLEYTGSFSCSLDSILIKNIEGTDYTLYTNSNTLFLQINATRLPTSIEWKGGLKNNAWDWTLTKNWTKGVAPVKFVKNDSVLLSNAGSPNTTVSVVGEVEPSNVLVNSTVNYIFTGTGSIIGSGGLTKTGSGKLTISNTNDYTGPTLLNGGIVEVRDPGNAGVPGYLGAATNVADNLVFNGGTLSILNSLSASNRNIRLENAGGTYSIATTLEHTINGIVSGTGALTKTGRGKLILTGKNTQLGGIVVKDGEVYLSTEIAIYYAAGTGAFTLESGTLSMLQGVSTSTAPWNIIVPATKSSTLKPDSVCTFTGSLTGAGILGIYSPGKKSKFTGNWSGFTGQIDVSTDSDGGLFLLGNKAGCAGTSLNLANNVKVFYLNTSSDTIEIGALSGATGSELGAGGDGTALITWKIGAKGVSNAFDGVITDAQLSKTGAQTAIIKTGQGNLSLTNSNTYTGGTVVENGTLTVTNTAGSGTGTGNVQVNGGGTLAGTGFVYGQVNLDSNAVLSPGVSGIGSLTILNHVAFNPGSIYLVDITPENVESDLIDVNGTLDLDGMLYISNIGSRNFAEGDSFTILKATKCKGEFSSIIPKTPAKGLVWDTKDLISSGKIKVITPEITDAINFGKSDIEFLVYPNPTSGVITIEFQQIEDYYHVIIYNASGTTVYSNEFHNPGYISEINMGKIEKGIYTMNIHNGKMNTFEKIIVH